WLKWIWQSLELQERQSSGVVQLAKDVQLQLTINLAEEPFEEAEVEDEPVTSTQPADALHDIFPLVRPVDRQSGKAIHRFSVTQLINYHRCPRQYYFDRVLRVPGADELSVWNNADAPEPHTNLTATLKGAVIHRFCELYTLDQSVDGCLRRSFDEVIRRRHAQLADRLVEINFEAAIRDLRPLAKNYLASEVFKRVEAAPKVSGERPSGEIGLWSEIGFRLRRPLGILFGVIDKLLITRSPDGGLQIEIIDFKTHRITSAKTPEPQTHRVTSKKGQIAFSFEDPGRTKAVHTAAEDYERQMQAYALAVRELLPSVGDGKLSATLHFLEPNIEVHLAGELLEPVRCAEAIDEAMQRSIYSSDPADFPVKPAPHCRMCNFLRVCTAGKEWVRDN
ncbi:MAG TPA: PD-(D/E)XK nuclease family protein, partial [Pyrinomonadaceae bacterium]|nr:PD-(D/E)XK nuclease family protein [Pyrinomonadaceae bacterium]